MSVETLGNSKNGEKIQNQFKIVIPGIDDTGYAQKVAGWTQSAAETMLPKTETEILQLFGSGNSVLIFNATGELMSHAAASFIYSDGSIEVGAVVTAPQHRGKGAGTIAVLAILNVLKEKYPIQTIFALANAVSSKIFEHVGASQMSMLELSAEVSGPCSQCSNNPGNGACCDTPYNLTHVVGGEII